MFDLAGNEAAPDLCLKAQEEAGERLSGHSNTEAEANGALGFSRDGVEQVKGAMKIGERLGTRALRTRCSTAFAWPYITAPIPSLPRGSADLTACLTTYIDPTAKQRRRFAISR